MGYQALLFCPDEKLARVVSQVFSELDFVVDPVSEPFAAVKKLMAQHYDAVVVDCDHEQNSSLLLKSAHTSTLNQGSLAIAMVEGQAGVARAYRIGANLVLTKPINLEQTKGTLRVARGLLRKNSEAASAVAHPSAPAPAATEAPTPVARPLEPANRIHEVTAASRHGQSPEFEASLPPMVASAKVEEKPAPVPAQKLVAPAPSAPPPSASREVAKNQASKTAAPVQMPVPVLDTTSTQGAASAPAPAKEIFAAPKKVTEKKKQDELPEMEPAAQASKSSTGAASTFDGPSFAALDDDNAGGSGSKKLLIAAVAVFAVAVAGYFGWTKFGQVHSNPAPRVAASVPQTQAAPAPDLAPTSTPASVPAPSTAAGTTKKTSALITAPALKPSSAPSGQPLEVATSPQNAMLQPEAKKAASTPLLVKSATANKHAQSDAPSVLPPSPLAVASPSDSGLGGLLSSTSSTVSRPSLARIRISQGVSQGMVIKRVQPRYPANALSAHIQGAVLIEATVNREGIVVNPKVLSGETTLAAAALEAVRQWRYKPYYLDGEPVEIQTQITINFKVN